VEALKGALRTLRAALLVALGSFAAPRRALAQEVGKEPIRLEYRASEGCPDVETFVARVRARTSRVRVALPGEAARTFAIVLVDGSPASGEVGVVDGEHPESARRVQGATCSEVADALALIVGLAVNPRTTAAAPADEVYDRGVPGTVPPPSSSQVERPERRSARLPAAGSVFAGADFTVTSGLAPDARVGGSPYVGWQAREDSLVAPEVRLAVVRSVSAVPAGSSGTASFDWTAGRLDGCPIAWRRATLRLRPCARIEVGSVGVATVNVPAPRSLLRGWFAAGPLIRAQWNVIDTLFADAELALLLRATNDRFVVLPDSTVYQVPVLGLTAGLGVGALFP
jgi:hypothetical protein